MKECLDPCNPWSVNFREREYSEVRSTGVICASIGTTPFNWRGCQDDEGQDDLHRVAVNRPVLHPPAKPKRATGGCGFKTRICAPNSVRNKSWGHPK